MINEAFAKRYLPTEDPIGRQVRLKELESLPDGNAVSNAVFDIVGVISDAKNRGVVEPPLPEVFLPYTITGVFRGGFLVKAHESPEALTSAVRREVWAVDRGVAITDIGTLDSYLTR